MSNPLKIFTVLTASQGVSVSNGLNVASGNATVAGVQIATVANVTGAIANFATRNEVTGVLTTLTSSFVAKDGSGNVTIGGNLTVQGTTTSIDSTIVNIGDKSIALASGSTTLSDANGSGFSVGSGSDGLARFQYNHASTAFKSSENIDVGSGKSYKVDGTTILGNAAVTPQLTGTYLTDGAGNLAGIGQVVDSQLGINSSDSFLVDVLSTNLQKSENIFLVTTATTGNIAIKLAASQGGDISIDATAGANAGTIEIKGGPINISYNGAGFDDYNYGNTGILNLTGALEFLSSSLGNGGGITGAEVSGAINTATGSVKTAVTNSYRQVRVFAKGLITGSTTPANRVTFLLSGSTTTAENTSENVLKGLYGMSDASADTLLQTKAGALSFDVALYDGANKNWTNDLVSVYITASQGSSGSLFYPKFVIDAPGASNQTEIRLIVVNENPEDFDIV